MAHIEGDIVIKRPVDEVFDFVADERNEPRYNPRMLRAEKVTDGPIGEGTQFRAETATRRGSAEMAIEITRYERPSRLESSTRLFEHGHRGSPDVRSGSGGNADAVGLDVRPRGVLKLMGPIISRMGERQEQ